MPFILFLKSIFKLKKKNSGFALIETAISIVILGIVVSSASHIFISMKKYSLIRNEKHNVDRIIFAMAEYLNKKKRLPLPKNVTEVDGILVGEVNYETIGLCKHNVFDRRNKIIKYVVDQRLTVKKISLIKEKNEEKNSLNLMLASGDDRENIFCTSVVGNNIKILDENGRNIPNDAITFILLKSDANTVDIRDSECLFWMTVDGFLMKYLKLSPSIE